MIKINRAEPVPLRPHHGDKVVEGGFVVVEDQDVFAGVDQLLHDQVLAASAKVDPFLFRQVFVEQIVAGKNKKSYIY